MAPVSDPHGLRPCHSGWSDDDNSRGLGKIIEERVCSQRTKNAILLASHAAYAVGAVVAFCVQPDAGMPQSTFRFDIAGIVTTLTPLPLLALAKFARCPSVISKLSYQDQFLWSCRWILAAGGLCALAIHSPLICFSILMASCFTCWSLLCASLLLCTELAFKTVVAADTSRSWSHELTWLRRPKLRKQLCGAFTLFAVLASIIAALRGSALYCWDCCDPCPSLFEASLLMVVGGAACSFPLNLVLLSWRWAGGPLWPWPLWQPSLLLRALARALAIDCALVLLGAILLPASLLAAWPVVLVIAAVQYTLRKGRMPITSPEQEGGPCEVMQVDDAEASPGIPNQKSNMDLCIRVLKYLALTTLALLQVATIFLAFFFDVQIIRAQYEPGPAAEDCLLPGQSPFHVSTANYTNVTLNQNFNNSNGTNFTPPVLPSFQSHAAADNLDQGFAWLLKSVGLGSIAPAGALILQSVKTVCLQLGISFSQVLTVQCAGLRRLISAVVVWATVLAASAIGFMDVITVQAAGGDILGANLSAQKDISILRYLTIICSAQLLEAMSLVVLQLVVSVGSSHAADAFMLADPCLGYLIGPSHPAWYSCKNPLHLPVDILAFCALSLGIVFAVTLVIMAAGGFIYGFPPARMAVQAVFGKNLKLATFDSRENHVTYEGDTPSQGDGERYVGHTTTTSTPRLGLECLRPLMGLHVSFGIWTSQSSQAFRVGLRREWYEPHDQAISSPTDLVSWRSIYYASSKVLALAWIALPGGALMAKGTEYLNRQVIFAFGSMSVAGLESRPIRYHFEEDDPSGRLMQILNWSALALQFSILVAIQVRLLDGPPEKQLTALGICVGVIVVLVVVRVMSGIRLEIRSFDRFKALQEHAERLLASNAIPCLQQVAAGGVAQSDSDADGGRPQADSDEGKLILQELASLCPIHRSLLLKAAEELMELDWPRVGFLPPQQLASLAALSKRDRYQHRRCMRVLELLTAAQQSQIESKGKQAALASAPRSELLLMIRESAEADLSVIFGPKAARRTAAISLKQAVATHVAELRTLAGRWAAAEVVNEAKERAASAAERGMSTQHMCWHIEFSASTCCETEVVAKSVATGRQIGDPARFSAFIAVRGHAKARVTAIGSWEAFPEGGIVEEIEFDKEAINVAWAEEPQLTAAQLQPQGQEAAQLHSILPRPAGEDVMCSLCEHGLKAAEFACSDCWCVKSKMALEHSRGSICSWKLAPIEVHWKPWQCPEAASTCQEPLLFASPLQDRRTADISEGNLVADSIVWSSALLCNGRGVEIPLAAGINGSQGTVQARDSTRGQVEPGILSDRVAEPNHARMAPPATPSDRGGETESGQVAPPSEPAVLPQLQADIEFQLPGATGQQEVSKATGSQLPILAEPPPVLSTADKAVEGLRTALAAQPPTVEELKVAVACAAAAGLKKESCEELQTAKALLAAMTGRRRSSWSNPVFENLRASCGWPSLALAKGSAWPVPGTSASGETVRTAVQSLKKQLPDSKSTVSWLESLLTELEELLLDAHQAASASGDHLAAGLADLHTELLSSMEEARRDLHNELVDMRGGLRVMCRIRPLSAEEQSTGSRAVVQCRSDGQAVSVEGQDGQETVCSLTSAFGSEASSRQVFEACKDLIQCVLDGHTVGLLTYGPVGAGKTHTMQGSLEEPGLAALSTRELFRLLRLQRSQQESAKVQVQLLELYNDQLIDVLHPSASSTGRRPSRVSVHSAPIEKPQLRVRLATSPPGAATRAGGEASRVEVDGATFVTVSSAEELLVLFEARAARHVARTSRSTRSFRSHLLLTVLVTHGDASSNTLRSGKLVLGDLAGLQRIGAGSIEESERRELIGINRSLTALSDVVQALLARQAVVPYRNHLLTQLLQDCFGWGAKAAILVNLSPAASQRSETMSALSFALRAKGALGDADVT